MQKFIATSALWLIGATAVSASPYGVLYNDPGSVSAQNDPRAVQAQANGYDRPNVDFSWGITGNSNPWSGLYVGVNAGGSLLSGSAASFSPSSAIAGVDPYLAQSLTGSPSGKQAQGLYGVQLGYDWRAASAVVAGLVTDFGLAGGKSISSTSSTIVDQLYPGITEQGALDASKSLNYFGTVRLRFGVLVANPLLLYLTGGLAYGDAESVIGAGAVASGPAGLGAFSLMAVGKTDVVRFGWTLGAGAEWMVLPHLGLTAEYLFYDLGSVNSSANYTFGAGGLSAATSAAEFYDRAFRRAVASVWSELSFRGC